MYIQIIFKVIVGVSERRDVLKLLCWILYWPEKNRALIAPMIHLYEYVLGASS